jgi:hypothetical protein
MLRASKRLRLGFLSDFTIKVLAWSALSAQSSRMFLFRFLGSVPSFTSWGIISTTIIHQSSNVGWPSGTWGFGILSMSVLIFEVNAPGVEAEQRMNS